MSDDTETARINAPAPSMLATAALLGARRRWTRVAGADHESPSKASAAPVPEASAATGRPPLVMPLVHLEDPEWSRAVLGLLALGQPTRVPATALLLRSDCVEVAFPGAVRLASEPFERAAATSWRLARHSRTLADLPSTPTIVAASRRSALVTAWVSPDARCLVDLVGCGSVALDGPPVAVGATLSDVVVELATRRWCDLDELVVVGFGSEIAGLERALCMPDIDTATKWLLACAEDPNLAGRARCLVVAPPIGRRSPSNLHPLRSLVELVHVLPSTGLICCDPSVPAVRAVWRLASHRETVDLTWRRRGIVQLRLGPAVEAADAPVSEGRAEDVDLGSAEWSAAPSDVHPAEEEAAAPDVQPSITVRVLGPVEVVNACTSLDRRPRVTELVVYLALHPHGCSGDAIAAALWPERRVPAQTLANRLSEARQALGETEAGLPRLRRVSSRHVLARDVSTDWAAFDALTRPGTTPAQWTAALELVRGRPFEGLTESGWALLEGFLSQIEGRIIDTACRLAAASLDDGNAVQAEWAIRRGLAASPWDERLYRMLMVVNHASGNRGGIDSALRSLAHVLDWRGDPLEGVHPETAQLYRQLIVDRAIDR